MARLFVSHHAEQRYRERVEDGLSTATVIERLTSPVIRQAAAFGAPYVRLPGGQRVVIERGSIVTVLPKEQNVCALVRRRKR